VSPKIKRPDNADTLRGRQGGDYIVYNKDKQITADMTLARRGKSDASLATLGDIKQFGSWGFDLSLTSDAGWTKETTSGGTIAFTNNTVVFAPVSAADPMVSSLYNTTDFDLNFTDEWEVEWTFSQLGEQSSVFYGWCALKSPSENSTALFAWGNYSGADDETYIYGGCVKAGVTTKTKLCTWAESTEYKLKMIGRGTSIEYYVNDVLYKTLNDVGTNISSTVGVLDKIQIDYGNTTAWTAGANLILTGLSFSANTANAGAGSGVAALANADMVASLDDIIVTHTDVDDTPVDGDTADPISSNWAHDHDADADAHHDKDHDHSSSSEGGDALAPKTLIMAGGAGSQVTLPALTLTERDALPAVAGMIIKNTTWNTIDICWYVEDKPYPYWYSIPLQDWVQSQSFFCLNCYLDADEGTFYRKIIGTANILRISDNGFSFFSAESDEAGSAVDLTASKVMAVGQAGTLYLYKSGIEVPALALIDGRDVSVDGAKLDGIAAGATVDDHMVMVVSGDTAKYLNEKLFVTSDLSIIEAAPPNSRMTIGIANPFTEDDETKLDGIEALADVTDADNVLPLLSHIVCYEDAIVCHNDEIVYV
jgi:hypothetical protein